MSEERESVLLVDDSTQIRELYQKVLGRDYRVDLAGSAEEGLQFLEKGGPYAVVISDFSLPGMDGIQFLARVRETHPDTVRMILTGFSEQQVAVEAVNEGNVYRFLNKPCSPETLLKTVQAGIQHYHLLRSEKELLEETLNGAVKVLTEILSLASPLAFSRSVRVRQYVKDLVQQLGLEESWKYEIAAMLSQIGCITLPPSTVERFYRGDPLTPDEQKMFDAHPACGAELIGNIPRLQEVARIVAYQEKLYDGGGVPDDRVAGEQIPLGARLLKATQDLVALEAGGVLRSDALERLRARRGWYDPRVLDALAEVVKKQTEYRLKSVSLQELDTSMILAGEVRSRSGLLLIGKGHQVSQLLIQRLANLHDSMGVRQPLQVLVPVEKDRPS